MARKSHLQVLERCYESALIGLDLSDGLGIFLTYLLFLEVLVALDPPGDLWAQALPCLLDGPCAQASPDHLRTTGKLCRHPDDAS